MSRKGRYSPEETSSLKREPLRSSLKIAPKRFAILMDFENLEKNIDRTKLHDFSWLLNPILEQGKISCAYVFIPDHYGSNPPVRTLSNIHRFFCVFCPKKSGILKDADSVDNRMDELGRFLVEHSDITDLVVVSGDADFQGLIEFARWKQKRVKVVSAHEAISGRILFDKNTEVLLV